MDTVDGDYQAMKANDGAFVRKHFFGQRPEAARDGREDERRGHLAPATAAATTRRRSTRRSTAPRNHKGQPTVLLVKTVKGFGMGKSGEGKNTAHQTKKLIDEDMRAFRDRFNIPIPDDKLADIPFYKPADDTPEMKYLHERRKALGGYLPQRRAKADEQLKVPPLDTFKAVLEPTAEGREISTTQAFVRFLTQLLRDKELGPRAVPILVDEARTFGMEGLFRQIGIYNPAGPEVHAGRPRPGHRTTARTRPARSCRKASTKPGGMSQLDRRGDVVLDEQPHHGAVLRLLLDVRLPARRRPGLGGRRHAGARLPARRHLGAHDAERRGPAARGRPQPHPGAAPSRTASATTRPSRTRSA